MEMKYLITLIFCGSVSFALVMFLSYVEYTRRKANRCIRDQFSLEFGSEVWQLLTELRDLRAHDSSSWDWRETKKERLRDLLIQSGVHQADADDLIMLIEYHPITWQSRLAAIDSFKHLV